MQRGLIGDGPGEGCGPVAEAGQGEPVEPRRPVIPKEPADPNPVSGGLPNHR